MHSHLGVLGVTGFRMKDLAANPLDHVEGGKWSARRAELSAWLDALNPDLSAFEKRGGNIGTNDTLASPASQPDYYQAVLDKMGLRLPEVTVMDFRCAFSFSTAFPRVRFRSSEIQKGSGGSCGFLRLQR